MGTASTSRIVDDLTGHLRGRILAGEFSPDTKLSESGIANEYGVARPTARSAIETLVADALLVRSAHLQPRVPDIPPDQVREILRILEFSEGIALERVLATSVDLRELKEASRSSTHRLLDVLVRCSRSARLSWMHRRTTFEYLLAVRQHRLFSLQDALSLSARSGLVEAIFRDDAPTAERTLHELQEARLAPARQLVDAVDAVGGSGGGRR